MKTRAWIILLVAALGLGGTAWADEARGPDAFYGRYRGTGMAEDPNVMALGFEKRDFDVEIGAAPGGFFVAWTTVTQSQSGKAIKRKNTRVVFEPTRRPGIYAEHVSPESIANGFSWASISGKTLTVEVVTILDDGGYEMQSYRRSLTKDGLYLAFRSDRDGALIKIVTAYLQKQAK